MKYSYLNIKLITALFISKFGREAIKMLGYKNFSEAYKQITKLYKMKSSNSLRLYKNEFDPLITNFKKGFKNRKPHKQILNSFELYGGLSLSDLFDLVNKFVNKFDFYVDYENSNVEEYSYHKIIYDINKIKNNLNLSFTTKKRLIDARIGQGNYRAHLMKIFNNRCPITGIQTKDLLIASHIKPWSISTNEERLDPWNGLLLSSNLDKLFDKGYITFSDEGFMIISSKLRNSEIQKINLDKYLNKKIILSIEQKRYLNYHRNSKFIS